MEQPCYKCGQTVEEGRIFCPNCSAPQIRVLIAEPVAAASLSQITEASSSEGILPASETIPVLALPVQWSRALKPCFLAALVASVLMLLGLHPFVVMPSAGFLAVVFYRQGQQNLAVRTGVSIRVGAFSGLLSSGFMVLMTALAATIPDLRSKMHDQLLEKAQQSFASQTDNPVFGFLLSQLKTPDGFVLVLVLLCGIAIVLSLILGGIGGAAAGAIFGRRTR
jgi:hypothetical protein